MTWFAAHAMHYFEYLEGEQTDYFVWEHIYLIRAETTAQAFELSKERARKDETTFEQSGMRRFDRPVNIKFAGIRRLISCQDEAPESGLPTHGAELSYQEFGFTDPAEFQKYVNGDDALMLYFGIEPDE